MYAQSGKKGCTDVSGHILGEVRFAQLEDRSLKYRATPLSATPPPPPPPPTPPHPPPPHPPPPPRDMSKVRNGFIFVVM